MAGAILKFGPEVKHHWTISVVIPTDDELDVQVERHLEEQDETEYV